MRLAAALVLASTCAAPNSGRYSVEEDLGSRHHLRYVFDHETRRWANRECELRVDPAREGEVSVEFFRPGSVQTAYYQSAGDHRWRLMEVLSGDDLAGKTAYGVQIPNEPMEIFPLPPPGDPGVWSEWRKASTTREGAFGWWREVHGAAPESAQPPAHPFELRCRVFLADVPGTLP